MKSPTGQRYRTTSITVEAEADICDFDTLDLVDELIDRARTGDRQAKQWVNTSALAPLPNLKEDWPDLERALNARDFDFLARWLWPQIREQHPKPPAPITEQAP